MLRRAFLAPIAHYLRTQKTPAIHQQHTTRAPRTHLKHTENHFSRNSGQGRTPGSISSRKTKATLIIPHNVAARPRSQRPPGFQADPVTNEVYRAVHEEHVNAAVVIAAR